MEKFRDIGICISAVVIFYLFLFLILPIFVDISTTTNATLHASHNMAQYPGSADFVVSIPWLLYFIPGAVGIGAIIFILRRQD